MHFISNWNKICIFFVMCYFQCYFFLSFLNLNEIWFLHIFTLLNYQNLDRIFNIKFLKLRKLKFIFTAINENFKMEWKLPSPAERIRWISACKSHLLTGLFGPNALWYHLRNRSRRNSRNVSGKSTLSRNARWLDFRWSISTILPTKFCIVIFSLFFSPSLQLPLPFCHFLSAYQFFAHHFVEYSLVTISIRLSTFISLDFNRRI